MTIAGETISARRLIADVLLAIVLLAAFWAVYALLVATAP